MKAFAVVLCAVVSVVAGGQLAAWPGSALPYTLVRTLPQALPASRTVAYSTTQFIGNPLQYSYYQFPQSLSPLSPVHSYYPGAAYFPPAGAIYYPSAVAPILEQDSLATFPGASYPTQTFVDPTPAPAPAGDSDTAVIDSSDFPNQSTERPFADAPSNESPTPTPAPQPIFPGFPSLPSIPQLPQLPSFPNFPSFPQAPSTPPPSQDNFGSFPSADREDKGLNDEDTVSVESA